VASVPNDDRTIPTGLTIGVFVTVLALIALVLAAQRIPHAKRPAILHPQVVVTTTVPNSPHGLAPWPGR
jgi:hypothetical protein